MPYIIESSEVFFSEELTNDNPRNMAAPRKISQILNRIHRKSAGDIQLREENQVFMDTLHEFLECRAKMDAKCDEMDETLQPLVMSSKSDFLVEDLFELEQANQYNAKYQQESITGTKVKSLSELYDAARKARPIFVTKMEDLVQDFCQSIGTEQGNTVVLDIADFKAPSRALEKAKQDYERRLPGPAASWLYDVVRGSLTFSSSNHLVQFVKMMKDSDLSVIKSKNRFQRPAFTGYRDWLLHIQIDSGLGFHHICELQLHCKAIKDLSAEQGSYAYYDYFSCYFGDADRDLEDRIEELKVIAKGKKYSFAMLDSFLSETTNMSRLKRLSHLFHYRLGEYEIAAKLECHILLGSKVCDMADSYERLGEILMRHGHYEKARLMHENALHIRSDTVGVRHHQTASSYSHLAMVLEKQGQAYTAVSMHNKALCIRMEALGDKHALVASSYNQLGSVWENIGRFEDAKSMYQKALQIRLDTLGDNDLSVATSHSNIAGALERLEKYDEALLSHQRALQIRQEMFGDRHRSVAYSLNKIGGVLKDLEKYEEAKSMHQQALEIQLELLGETTPSVATSYSNLGAILIRQGQYEEAKAMHDKALQIRLETLGDKHTSVANSYSTLGVILVKQQHYDDGRTMHEHALQLRLEALGEKHVSVASSYHCLGVVLEKQGEYKEAENMHRRALQIRSEILGEDHSTVSTSSRRLKLVLEKQKDDKKRSREARRRSSMILSTVAASYNCFRSVLKMPEQDSKEAYDHTESTSCELVQSR